MKSRDELILKLNILLKRIKTFSCPEYKDIFTKAYFQEVEKMALENFDNTYAFIFGDFNKLGVINEVHGHDFGNMALEIALRIIKKSLPKDSVIVRAGGDELYIILPNSNKENADKYITLINDNLQKNAITISGLSIELASSDSTNGDIEHLINITDNAVTDKKAARKESNSPADILADDFIDLQVPKSVSDEEKDSWEELNKFINISVYEFLKNFRPSKNFKFKPQQIIDSSDFITNSFLCLLNDKLHGNLPQNLTSILKNDYPYSPDYVTKANDEKSEKYLDYTIADIIQSFVTGNKTISEIDTLSDEDLQNLVCSSSNLLEKLVRDNTGLLNKHYFRLSLAQHLCDTDEEYSASYVSFAGLKLSNTAYDHTFSDYRLDKSNKILCEETDKLLNYVDTAFDFDKGNIYFISQGGGNYLYLYPKSMSKDVQPKISHIIDEVNSKVNIKDPNSNFETSYYSMSSTESLPKSDSKSVIRYVRALKEEANSKKNGFKRDLFKSADAFYAFKKSTNNCINYYLENIPNADKDINKMLQFMRNIYTSFLNQEVLHNDTRKNMPETGLTSYNKEQVDGWEH